MDKAHVHKFTIAYDPICVECGHYKFQFPSVTGKVMCESISKYLKNKMDIDKSPIDIWEYSPTGELSFVFDMYRHIKIMEMNIHV